MGWWDGMVQIQVRISTVVSLVATGRVPWLLQLGMSFMVIILTTGHHQPSLWILLGFHNGHSTSVFRAGAAAAAAAIEPLTFSSSLWSCYRAANGRRRPVLNNWNSKYVMNLIITSSNWTHFHWNGRKWIFSSVPHKKSIAISEKWTHIVFIRY